MIKETRIAGGSVGVRMPEWFCQVKKVPDFQVKTTELGVDMDVSY